MQKFREFSRTFRQYLHLAHQYWYPAGKGSNVVFTVLILLLMGFIASFLYFIIYGAIIGANAFIPAILKEYTPGLVDWIINISGSRIHYAFIAGIIAFPVLYIAYAKKIKGRHYAWIMLFVLLTLSMAVSGINVILSYVGRYWQTALQQMNADAFWKNILFHLGTYIFAMPIVVFYPWVQGLLGIRWRKYLTGYFTGKYFSNRAYFEIYSNKGLDNPDQRISEDVRSFTANSLDFLLIILGAMMDLAAFTLVLLTISSFLAKVLLIYAFGGTLITVLLGKRLIGLNFEQLKREANFRYSLVHIRDNAESIAFFKGEKSERKILDFRFASIIQNYLHLIGWQRNLRIFTRYYGYMVVLLPYMILAPMFFSKKIEFGQMYQASFAFSQILGALSIVVTYFTDISSYVAGTRRLISFEKVLDSATGVRIDSAFEKRNMIERVASDTYSINNLDLYTPDFTKQLLKGLSAGINGSRRLLIAGPSGSGKSSLIRTIAGLWRSGSGTVTYPGGHPVFFIPQKPYITLGSLKEQLLYPDTERQADNTELIRMLEAVKLEDLAERAKEDPEILTSTAVNWNETLSLGEQQRLAFARLLFSRPEFAILDEATSALDVENERNIYERLEESGIRYISVGHRPQMSRYHDAVLLLDGNGGWKIVTPDEYMRELMV